MVQRFFYLFDTNDVVFIVTLVVIGAIIISLNYLLKKKIVWQECKSCHGLSDYLTYGGICQDCAWQELRMYCKSPRF